MTLTKNIAEKSHIGFWAYSGAFSYCFKCKTMMKGLQDKCVMCGDEDYVEWYDRVTGYVQQVGHKKDSNGGWNKGKKQELVDRYRHELGG
jgi:ribonucleoside-triphosphate reductase